MLPAPTRQETAMKLSAETTGLCDHQRTAVTDRHPFFQTVNGHRESVPILAVPATAVNHGLIGVHFFGG